MPDIKFILDKRDGTIIMPLRPSDPVGSMEAFVVRSTTWLSANLSEAQKDALVAWLQEPYETRESRKYPNAKLPLTQAEKDRWRAIIKRRRGNMDRPVKKIYFYDSVDDKVVGPAGFDESRLFQIIAVSGPMGDVTNIIPADPIDDGRYYGPTTMADAVSRIVTPPTEADL
jgi:hypothetical protein